MKPLTKLPRFRLNLTCLLNTADCYSDLLTYDSDIRSLAYVEDSKSVLIMTGCSGYLRIKREDIDTLIEELKYIHEGMDRRR